MIQSKTSPHDPIQNVSTWSDTKRLHMIRYKTSPHDPKRRHHDVVMCMAMAISDVYEFSHTVGEAGLSSGRSGNGQTVGNERPPRGLYFMGKDTPTFVWKLKQWGLWHKLLQHNHSCINTFSCIFPFWYAFNKTWSLSYPNPNPMILRASATVN